MRRGCVKGVLYQARAACFTGGLYTEAKTIRKLRVLSGVQAVPGSLLCLRTCTCLCAPELPKTTTARSTPATAPSMLLNAVTRCRCQSRGSTSVVPASASGVAAAARFTRAYSRTCVLACATRHMWIWRRGHYRYGSGCRSRHKYLES
eukprot:1209554-Pyramimonas_sp.AAC.1